MKLLKYIAMVIISFHLVHTPTMGGDYDVGSRRHREIGVPVRVALTIVPPVVAYFSDQSPQAALLSAGTNVVTSFLSATYSHDLGDLSLCSRFAATGFSIIFFMKCMFQVITEKVDLGFGWHPMFGFANYSTTRSENMPLNLQQTLFLNSKDWGANVQSLSSYRVNGYNINLLYTGNLSSNILGSVLSLFGI